MSGLRWWVLALGSAMAIAGCASVPTARTDAAAGVRSDAVPLGSYRMSIGLVRDR